MPKKLLITIGLPFSGKTVLAKQYAEKGWEIINRDELLEQIINSEEFKVNVGKEIATLKPKSHSELFDIRNRLATQMISEAVKTKVLTSENENLFYDGTNLRKETRAGILDLNKAGVEVEGIFLDIPVEVLIERIKKIYTEGDRAGQFNESAIINLRRMAEVFEEPSKEEGFSELIIIGREGDEPDAEIRHGRR
jgi:predicted kinase